MQKKKKKRKNSKKNFGEIFSKKNSGSPFFIFSKNKNIQFLDNNYTQLLYETIFHLKKNWRVWIFFRHFFICVFNFVFLGYIYVKKYLKMYIQSTDWNFFRFRHINYLISSFFKTIVCIGKAGFCLKVKNKLSLFIHRSK